jgi:hypothetical protein
LNRNLHIVCWDAPWPANNSIAIDVYYKIEALHKQGIKIHLHYFSAEPSSHPTELNRYCETVHPYQCSKEIKNYLPSPCETSIRLLIETLNKDKHPVLLAGINCAKIIKQVSGMERRTLVRLYKDECRHYSHLAETSSFIKKFQLSRLSRQMKIHEDALPQNCLYAFSTKNDADSFKEDHHLKNVYYLPLSFPYQTIESETGIGNFCLYHGDLSNPDNEKAVLWLLTNVFNDISTPLVIAGKKPGERLKKLAEFYSHTCLITDPTQTEMDDLIRKAHINILPSFTNKRPELKLLHALFNGRHCVVNDNAVTGSPLKDACHVGSNANAFKSIILQLYHQPFEQIEIDLRKRLLQQNKKEEPAKMLVEWLYG